MTTTSSRRAQSSGDGRVPPHNLDAEAALLGGAMLSDTVAQVLVARTVVEDFYRPAHQHIAQAIHDVASGGPGRCDAVLVAAALRQRGLLDECGGTEYLLELQTVTPALSNAARYATLVRSTSTLRRLLAASATIADAAYNEADPTLVLNRALEVIGKVADVDTAIVSNLDIADVGALLDGNLQPEQPSLMTRTDGGSLLYPGKIHNLQAEPSAGKTWLAVILICQVLAMGGAAVYLDYEDTASGIIARLLEAGAEPAAVRARFRYVQPSGKFGVSERVELAKLIDDLNPDVVIIDTVGEALSRDGLSEDSNTDVILWTDRLPRWIARTGAAVLLLDHVAKDPEARGRWARGAGAKLGVIDGASYQVKVVHPFSRQKPGSVKLIVAKDKPGGVGAIGDVVAVMNVDPKGNGERVLISLVPGGSELLAPTDSWKPTNIMGKLSAALESAVVPMNATALTKMVHGKPAIVREALTRLIAEGFIAEGSGRHRALRLVTPYHDQSTPRTEPPLPDPDLFDGHDFEAADLQDDDYQHSLDHLSRNT